MFAQLLFFCARACPSLLETLGIFWVCCLDKNFFLSQTFNSNGTRFHDTCCFCRCSAPTFKKVEQAVKLPIYAFHNFLSRQCNCDLVFTECLDTLHAVWPYVISRMSIYSLKWLNIHIWSSTGRRTLYCHIKYLNIRPPFVWLFLACFFYHLWKFLHFHCWNGKELQHSL